MKEWIASDMIETDPLRIPAVSFKPISKEFERTETLAALTFFDILLLG
jgi:hypothetical protein